MINTVDKLINAVDKLTNAIDKLVNAVDKLVCAVGVFETNFWNRLVLFLLCKQITMFVDCSISK